MEEAVNSWQDGGRYVNTRCCKLDFAEIAGRYASRLAHRASGRETLVGAADNTGRLGLGSRKPGLTRSSPLERPTPGER